MQQLPPDKLLHRLDLAIRQRIEGTAHGETAAFGVRGGIELERIRPWSPGDDWRLLDPAATARTGEPHVRVPVAERRLTLWLGIDISSSMAFGTQNWEKGELATSVAAAFGMIALREAGKVGAMPLGRGDERPIPPRAGRPALLALLEGVKPTRSDLPGKLAKSLARLERAIRERGAVVVVSDFRDADLSWRGPLARIAGRNETICVAVQDPREDELPDIGITRFLDPETGRRFVVDTSSAKIRKRFADRARTRRTAAELTIQEAGADLMKVSTADDWLDSLVAFVTNRRRKRWGSVAR